MKIKNKIRFGLIADPHVFNPERASKGIHAYRGQFAAGKEKLQGILKAMNRQAVDFVVFLGDMTDFFTRGNLKYFHDITRTFSGKTYFCFGNHDFVRLNSRRKWMIKNNDHIKRSWLKKLGLSNAYYSFDVKNTHFIVLYTIQRKGIDDRQLKWLKNDIKNNKNRPLLVFSHCPFPFPELVSVVQKEISADLPEYLVTDNYKAVINLFKRHRAPVRIYCGHIHISNETVSGNIKQVVVDYMWGKTPCLIQDIKI